MRIPTLTVTILAFLAAHLVMAGVIPLVEDEAYYALWATAPAWGYYDHPPMIAWMIYLGEALIGEHRLGVRLLPLLAFASVTILVWRLALLAGGDRTAARIAALWFNAGLLIFIGGFGASPDPPSILFWTATVWATAEALVRPRFWLLAGAFVGLGALSKFTNLFLAPGLLIWLLATPSSRAQLRTPWPWIAGLIAAAVIAPLIAWNIAHDWLGLERQFSRIGGGQLQPAFLAQYGAVLIVSLSPLAFWAAVITVLRRTNPVVTVLCLTSLPMLLFFAYYALSSSVQGNWPAPALPAIAVLAGLGAARWKPGLIWLGAGLGVVPALLVMVVGFWPGEPLRPGHTLPNQTKGWPEFVAETGALADATGAEWIATVEYGLTGALTFRLPDRAVHAVHQTYRYTFRAPFPDHLCDVPGLLIRRDDPRAPAVAGRFASVGEGTVVERRSGGIPIARYLAFPVQGLVTCPP